MTKQAEFLSNKRAHADPKEPRSFCKQAVQCEIQRLYFFSYLPQEISKGLFLLWDRAEDPHLLACEPAHSQATL